MTSNPISILIAALGGEGGGLLTEWIVTAAMRADLPVQSTSIPGVAQRTGATTYYIELFPQPQASLGDRRPVFGLYPSPGAVDVVIASELVEAGRMMHNGFVTPDRTTLIAATHRVYAIGERVAMADGRVSPERVLRAAQEMPRHAVLFDLTRDPARRSLPLNAVLLGALAGTGALPISPEHFRQAIVERGVAVTDNCAGFEEGLRLAWGEVPPSQVAEIRPLPARPRRLAELVAHAAARFPAEALRTVELGLERTADYQDLDYARLYLERLEPVLEADRRAGGSARGHLLTAKTARHLALWMSYEDVVRVADLKSRPERFARVREEVRAQPDQPMRVTEFLKPGVEEAAALLPRPLGRALVAWAERRNLLHRLHVPLRLNSASITGYAMLRALASLKGLRRGSFRFQEEQRRIEAWLAAIVKAADRDYGFATEVVELARLLKGYSDTFRRGRANYARIFDGFVAPALADPATDLAAAAAHLRAAREAALKDPDGRALDDVLAARPAPLPVAAE